MGKKSSQGHRRAPKPFAFAPARFSLPVNALGWMFPSRFRGFHTFFPAGAGERRLYCNGCTAVFVIQSIALSREMGGEGGGCFKAAFSVFPEPEAPRNPTGRKEERFFYRTGWFWGAWLLRLGGWGALFERRGV